MRDTIKPAQTTPPPGDKHLNGNRQGKVPHTGAKKLLKGIESPMPPMPEGL